MSNTGSSVSDASVEVSVTGSSVVTEEVVSFGDVLVSVLETDVSSTEISVFVSDSFSAGVVTGGSVSVGVSVAGVVTVGSVTGSGMEILIFSLTASGVVVTSAGRLFMGTKLSSEIPLSGYSIIVISFKPLTSGSIDTGTDIFAPKKLSESSSAEELS